ncbi:TetR/AcrR family transcriptional regulator [Lentilactobacillus kosonis]|uniref:Transcription regulator of multidrug efflux pump operon, TetR (AcrR) family n=1 Tax=Lentilactobacillus kosonis TaxID=2810561 RepID=A0A401FNY6_9LACO|nr:TetR/AcrR family transcriptional regulator [Lentilactobacillus kosonis]GAY74026.1 transcription regulator of multidrug efflux pump operon, TetR (AcrR) family [Lentilactobacillus kosonis]
MRAQDDEKRKRILDSTSNIIMTQGIAAVSLSKIAKNAGIASGTLYTYFKDKNDMLRALYLNRKERIAEAITQLDINGDPRQGFNHFMDLIYDYGQEHLDEFVLIREFGQSPILKSLNISQAEAYAGFESLEEFVQNGVSKQVFFDIDFQVILDYAYTPVIEYLISIQNGNLDPNKIPFEQIKMLSTRAIIMEESK